MTARIPQQAGPPAHADPRRRRVAFLSVAAGNFLVLLDTSILNVALPDVQRNLHAAAVYLPWASVAYTVVFAGLLLASGAVSDRIGPLRLYQAALGAFALLSLACAAAPDIGWLITGRALLGVAAAGMVPASLALLASLYPDPASRAKAIGAWAAITSSGLLAGPVLGGLLVTAGGWRLVFLVNPPVALLALLLARRLTNAVPASARPLDRLGILLSVVALGSLTFGCIEGGTSGWGRPIPVITLGVAILALTGLVIAERRSPHPVLPPGLLSRRQVRADVLAAAVATLVFYGMLYTLTLWYQRERGFTPLSAGLAFVPMTLPMCVLPIFTGRLVAHFGARHLILFGLSGDVLAGVLLRFVGVHSPVLWVVVAEIALVLASTTTSRQPPPTCP